MRRNPFYSFIAYLSLFVLLAGLIFPIPLAHASGAGIVRSPASSILRDEQLSGAFQETTGQIMARQAKLPLTSAFSWKDTRYPLSPFENGSLHSSGQRPTRNAEQAVENAQTTLEQPLSPLAAGAQSVGITFNSINADQAFPLNANQGFTPPDTMGVVGPTQFLTVLNGAIRASNKSNGATGFLDTSLDNFFASVRGAVGTGDPRVRFDRLTDRWVVTAFTQSATNNRILIAVSASTPEILLPGLYGLFITSYPAS